MSKEKRGRPRKHKDAVLVRLSTTIHPDLKKKIEDLAWLKSTSIAEIVTEILSEHVDTEIKIAKQIATKKIKGVQENE